MAVNALEIMNSYHAAMKALDADRFADLYSVDALHEMPFTHGSSGRLCGRMAIRDYYKSVWGQSPRRVLDIVNVVIHQMQDDECIACEFDIKLSSPAADEITASCVLILRIQHGQIVHNRDYMDMLAISNAINAVTAAQ